MKIPARQRKRQRYLETQHNAIQNKSLAVLLPQRKSKKTIETNKESLNLSKFELEYDVDPLFKKNCAMFDEGRNGGVNFLSSLILKVSTLHS